MKTVYCLLWESADGISEQVTQVHEVQMPDYGDPEFYRQTTSLAWFRERESIARFTGSGPIARWTQIRHQDEWDRDQKFWKSCGDDDTEQYADLPRFHHASIFDYYKAVNYDRRRQRYRVEQPCTK